MNKNDNFDQESSPRDRTNGFQVSIDDDKLDEVLSSAEEFDESFLEDTEPEELSSFSDEPPLPPRRQNRRRPEEHMPKKKKRRKKKNGCLYKMIYFIVICIVAVIVSQSLIAGINDMLAVNKGKENERVERTITVPEGAKTEEIADMLEKEGIIKEKWFFELYANITKATYRFGTYKLDDSMDYEALITYMSTTSKRTDIVKVTFPEGYTVEQIAKRLEENKVCTAEKFIDAVNNAPLDNEYVKALDNVSDRPYRLEGYLFPDTYQFYLNEDPVTVVKKFLDEGFRTRITKEFIDKADELGFTVDELMTLASIIQKEAAGEEMKMVSGIFQNRLKSKNLKQLQSDPTVWYPYVNREAVPPDIVAQFPEGLKYNTYEVEGLPLGPICNPGLDAIRAVINPKESNYLYFVVDVNGKGYYATTFAKHQENDAYRKTVKKIAASSDNELVDELNNQDETPEE